MILEEKKIPYEFLIRFNNEGRVNGAHIAYTETIIKDGQIIHSKQTDPQAVTLGIDEGFPLEDILGELNVLNVKEIELLQYEKSELEKTVTENEEEINSLNGELSNSNNRIKELEALLEQTKNDLEKSNSQIVEVNKTNEELIKQIPVKDETAG